MNASHQMNRAHKRAVRLAKRIRQTKDKANVYIERKEKRLLDLAHTNPAVEYLTIFGINPS